MNGSKADLNPEITGNWITVDRWEEKARLSRYNIEEKEEKGSGKLA